MGRSVAAWLAAPVLAGALLVPKCPLCLVAWLAMFGAGMGAMTAALPWLALVGFALAAWRFRRARSRPSCCAHTSRDLAR